MIEIDDLLEKTTKKERRHTLAVDESLDSIIESARRALGKKNVAEIMRRSIRAGIEQALARVGPKAS